jgi:hypothetical protein
MAIEGVLEAEELRDYLYARMRGARDERAEHGGRPFSTAAQPHIIEARLASPAAISEQHTLQTLLEIRNALQVLVARQGAKS